jgi:anaerobic magnesium-protoporphyrin IX monomethyl ester cyclase
MKIVLTTLHSRYSHASLALPCLAAACRDLEGCDLVIREYTINEPPTQVLQGLVVERPDLVLFSCYIWNIEQTLKLAADLKQILPETLIVLGGPEASFGAFELMTRNRAIDCIVRGEGEATCRELLGTLRATEPPLLQCHDVAGVTYRDEDHITATPDRDPITSLDTIPSPFALGLTDLTKPLVYLETSRGCPFSCAFCLSSVDRGVRSFAMTRIKTDLQLLMHNRVQTVKLVDRTFNYDPQRANTIWDFILTHNQGSRFHFEIAADLLTDANLRVLQQVPEGWFRFEIGVQSLAEDTLERVARQSNLAALFANIERLRRETQVHLHLDLVAGLPGEDFAGFTASLQRLLDAAPHHIQVEPLKVLKGTAMRTIVREEQYAFSETPPYRILKTPWLTFGEICAIETVSRLLDLIYNSGRFAATLTLLASNTPLATMFTRMARFWEEQQLARTAPLMDLFDSLWQFGQRELDPDQQELLRDTLCYDFCLADYPNSARVPAFFDLERSRSNGGKTGISREQLLQLGIGGGSKVRSYSRMFRNDYRALPWREGETCLTFIYISVRGKDQEVRVAAQADFSGPGA